MHPLLLVGAAVVLAGLVVRRRRLGRMTLAAGLVLAAALVVFGTGLIPLPDIATLIEDVGRTLGPWTYLFVGALAFLETGAFIGLLAPGETAVLVGGLVAGQGEISLLLLIALVWTCAVAGDVTSYMLGRRLGRAWLVRHGPRVKITEERLHEVERFFERHGGSAILVGRFIGLVRALAPFIAGTSRMPLRRFLPYDVLGAGLWGSLFCVLGYLFWRSLDRVTQYAGAGAFLIGTVVCLIGAALWVRRLNRDAAYRARVARAVRARPGGTRVLAAAPRVARPLRWLYHRLTPGELGLELTTLLALAAVGGFAFVVLSGERFAFDRDAAGTVRELRGEGIDREIAEVAARLGSLAVTGAVTIATAVWGAIRGRVREALAILAGLVLTQVAVAGFAADDHAARAVALVACAVVLVRAGHGLAVRFAAVSVAIVLVAVVVLGRVYLRVDDLSGVLSGAALGTAVFASCGLPSLVVGAVRHNQDRP